MAEMKGKARVSDQISSATVWTPREGQFAGIPRPDVHRFSLFLWSAFGGILGLDHFYMRSPWTGLAKLFTGGGFGLWWLWDAFQLGLESDRVVKYGMTAPFDLITGIGQGMIYDGKPTVYKSEKSFGFWVIAKILFGLIFDDHGWVALFKIIIFILTVISCVYISQGYLLWIIALFFAAPLCLANIWAWISDSYTIITNPTGFVNQGLPTPDFTYKSYLALKNWFVNSKTGKIIEGEQKPLESLQQGSTRIFPLKEGITPDKLQQMFAITHTAEMKEKPVQKGGAIPSFLKNPMAAVTQAASQVKTVAAGVTRQTRSTPPPATQQPAVPKDPQPAVPKDPQSAESKDPQSAESKDPQSAVPKDPQSAVPKDQQPAEPKDQQPAEPKDPQSAEPKDPGELQNQGVASGNPLATLVGRIWQSGVDNTLILGGYLKTAIQAVVIPPPILIQGKIMEKQLEMSEKLGKLPEMPGMPTAPALPQAPAMPSMPSMPQAPAMPSMPQAPAMPSLPTQKGGYRSTKEETLTVEAQIMGATVVALIAGGSLKGLVDYLMPQ